ncbi:D-alanyl-D-alanine endopeptidase [bacterium HR34]|nr:D-alanyl-D-alanine endopeptidase [bacterium HR34]
MSIKKLIFIFIFLFFVGFIFYLFYGENDINKNNLKAGVYNFNNEIIPSTIQDSYLENIYFSKIENLPFEARDSHTVYIFNGKMFLTGGLNAQDNIIDKEKGYVDYKNAKYFNDIWMSQDGKNWRLIKEHADFPPIRSASIVEFNSRLFLLGGWSPVVGYNVGVWESEDGITWKKIKNDPEFGQREGQQVIEFKDKLLLIGGVNYNLNGKKVVFNDVWESEDGVNWKLLTQNAGFSPRWDFGVVVYKNKIYLAGGMAGTGILFGDVWMSDDGKNWQLINKKPDFKKRQGQIMVTYKNKILLIGGTSSESEIENVWISEDGINWEKPFIKTNLPQIEDQSVVVFKDEIIVIGGMTKNFEWSNSIWISNFYTKEEIKRIITQEPWRINVTAKGFGFLKCDNEKCNYILKMNENKKLPIASLTKLMTSLVAIENYKIFDVLQIPNQAQDFNFNTVFNIDDLIKEGEKFYVLDLIKLSLIASSNKAPFTLASEIGYNKFVNMMQKKAQELKMENTYFQNPIGLDIKGVINLSSVDDLVKLIIYIKNTYPILFEITIAKEDEVESLGGKVYKLKNVNEALYFEEFENNILGSKTGTTPLAKENLILITKEWYIYIILNSSNRIADLKLLNKIIKTYENTINY